jgi:hypothetical protein
MLVTSFLCLTLPLFQLPTTAANALPAMTGIASSPVKIPVKKYNPANNEAAPSPEVFAYSIDQTDKDTYLVTGSMPQTFVELINPHCYISPFSLGWSNVDTPVKRGVSSGGTTIWDITARGLVIPVQQPTMTAVFHNIYVLRDDAEGVPLSIRDASTQVTQTLLLN